MTRPIYLDHHATTPCAPEAVAAMAPFFGAAAFGNPDARHSQHGRQAAAALQQAKTDIAALIHTTPETLVLLSGATEANFLAMATAAQTASVRREILVSAIEHDSMQRAVAPLISAGFTVSVVPVTSAGYVLPETLAAMVSEKTLIVSVMLANHEIGTIQPVADISAIARARGALLHCDMTQAVGRIPVDVQALGVDMASFTAHKLYGPVGIGALYMRGGAQPRMRGGTIPLALAVGFATACRRAQDSLSSDAAHTEYLANIFVKHLETQPIDFRINGGRAARVPGSLNIRFAGVDAGDLLLAVSPQLSLSSGAACTSAQGVPSQVLRAIGLSDVEISECIRLCFGGMNTEEEAIAAATILAAAIRKKI